VVVAGGCCRHDAFDAGRNAVRPANSRQRRRQETKVNTRAFIPGLKPSFSANPSHRGLSFLLQDGLHGFPADCSRILLSPIRFLLLTFSVFPHFLVVGQSKMLVKPLIGNFVSKAHASPSLKR